MKSAYLLTQVSCIFFGKCMRFSKWHFIYVFRINLTILLQAGQESKEGGKYPEVPHSHLLGGAECYPGPRLILNLFLIIASP
jgi:hypothetical protein